MQRTLPSLILLLVLAACQPGSDAALPGDSSDKRPFAGVAADEMIRFTGTEPFWGGETKGGSLTYSTPEMPDGQTIAVKRFAGRGGLSVAGQLEGQAFDLLITPGDCSDGMSDRSFPFVATLKIGSETRNGCGWTDKQGFTGPDSP